MRTTRRSRWQIRPVEAQVILVILAAEVAVLLPAVTEARRLHAPSAPPPSSDVVDVGWILLLVSLAATMFVIAARPLPGWLRRGWGRLARGRRREGGPIR